MNSRYYRQDFLPHFIFQLEIPSTLFLLLLMVYKTFWVTISMIWIIYFNITTYILNCSI